MRFFVTGSAGFIGFHLCRRLLADGHFVDGFDAMTPYYDPALKERRLALLAKTNGFRNTIGALEDMATLATACSLSSRAHLNRSWATLAALACSTRATKLGSTASGVLAPALALRAAIAGELGGGEIFSQEGLTILVKAA